MAVLFAAVEARFFPYSRFTTPLPARLPEFVIEHGVKVWEEDGKCGE